MEQGAASDLCDCGHDLEGAHVVVGDEAPCTLCTCVLEIWDELPPRKLSPQDLEELTKRMKGRS